MAIVNYVVEHIRFIEYASEEKLKGSEMLLWYALMHQMNQRAQGNVWPEEFVRIDNDRLLSYLPIKFDTFAAARNRLKQLGRIDYIPGERNKANPAYKMIYFYPNYVKSRAEEDGNGENPSPLTMPMEGEAAERFAESYPVKSDNIGDKTGFYPKKSDNMGYNMGGNIGYNIGYNMGSNRGDIYYKHKQETENRTKNHCCEEEEDDTGATPPAHVREQDDGPEDDPIPNRSRRMKALKHAFLRNFGRQGSTREIERVLIFCHASGMPDEIAMKGMEIAAGNGPGNPIEYTLTILEDWRQAHVFQAQQVDEYLTERDRMKNRGMMYGSGDVMEEWDVQQEARERRLRENIEAGLEKKRDR